MKHAKSACRLTRHFKLMQCDLAVRLNWQIKQICTAVFVSENSWIQNISLLAISNEFLPV